MCSDISFFSFDLRPAEFKEGIFQSDLRECIAWIIQTLNLLAPSYCVLFWASMILHHIDYRHGSGMRKLVYKSALFCIAAPYDKRMSNLSQRRKVSHQRWWLHSTHSWGSVITCLFPYFPAGRQFKGWKFPHRNPRTYRRFKTEGIRNLQSQGTTRQEGKEMDIVFQEDKLVSEKVKGTWEFREFPWRMWQETPSFGFSLGLGLWFSSY